MEPKEHISCFHEGVWVWTTQRRPDPEELKFPVLQPMDLEGTGDAGTALEAVPVGRVEWIDT